MKDRIAVLGFAALATVAAAGWMRQPASSSNDFSDEVQAPVTMAAAPQPDAANSAVRYAVYNETPARPVARPRVRTVASRDERRYDQQQRYSGDSYSEPVIQTERSKGKSAAIIVGSAAAGAAIGAMAGHGKGAAIGAITGGVAGTIYDRMTHKKTDGWGWGR